MKYNTHIWIIAIAILTGLLLTLFTSNFPNEEKLMTLTLTSGAYFDGGAIPDTYTCQGKDISPPLAWTGVPDGTQSLVLIIDDPDAPDPKAPKTIWSHWVLYNIPPDAAGLKEGISPKELPPGTQQGQNDWKRLGYGGPCPPIGRHRYRHKLYALDTVLEPMNSPTRTMLETVMEKHIIEQTQLVATYQK